MQDMPVITFRDTTPISPSRLKGLTLLAANLALIAIYLAASMLGITLAFDNEQVTIVWAPTGIALASILLWGNRILPGIALGALLFNRLLGEPLTTALGITMGNTLEAWIAAFMMRRFGGFHISMGQLRDVLSLVLFSAVCGAMLSANIGVISLCLGGLQPWSSYRSLWLLWWLGDATGALIVAPLLLVWSIRPRRFLRLTILLELSGMVTGLAIACMAIFAAESSAGMRGQSFIYVIFSFVIWGALRFGQRGTTLVTLVSTVIAIWLASHVMGPFSASSMHHSLTLLLIFMGVVAITGLFLGAAITERTHAAEALKIADRRKNEFLAMLAHELRTPLASLSNALHVIRHPGLTKEKTNETCQIMEHQLQQVTRLTNDLLDIARIAHGKVELRFAPVTLQDVIGGSLDVVKPVLQASNHRLSLRLAKEPILLNADADRLSQVFVNLLNNAAKYTPPGGHIAVDAGMEHGYAVVRISDNGIGIPSSMLPQIFNLFMQVDYSMDRSQGGLGIGLTLVKRLIELHGGKINAFSPGSFKGSEFVIQLPFITSSQAAPAEKTLSEA